MIVSTISPTRAKPIDPSYASIELTPENRFLAWASGRENVFLSGMAGTGKSFLLGQWMDSITGDKPDVTAPTGVAALNVKGMTLHRWCGMGLGPKLFESDEDYFYKTCKVSDQARERVTACKTLVIDEISMLSGRHFDFLNFLLKKIRGNRKPFGGVQIVTIGDFLQLPPVRIDQSMPYDWVFKSRAWEEAEFQTILLEKNHRQAGDADFIKALAGARMGLLVGNAREILQARIKSNPPDNMPRLFTHNTMVDRWNNGMLAELPGDVVELKGKAKGDAREVEAIGRSILTPHGLPIGGKETEPLRLKLGAMVMITVNNNLTGTVNGQIGFVKTLPKYEDGPVVVETREMGDVFVTPWRFTFRWRDKGAPEIMQYPLRLAYALTIHKAQGLTLDSAYIDIRAATEPGQAYVALSRVRGLNGMILKEWPTGIVVSQEAKKFYEEREN